MCSAEQALNEIEERLEFIERVICSVEERSAGKAKEDSLGKTLVELNSSLTEAGEGRDSLCKAMATADALPTLSSLEAENTISLAGKMEAINLMEGSVNNQAEMLANVEELKTMADSEAIAIQNEDNCQMCKVGKGVEEIRGDFDDFSSEAQEMLSKSVYYFSLLNKHFFEMDETLKKLEEKLDALKK